ncbi:GC-rich sequence DNA-binding factor-like protein [Striga asiatica]|uniref:GC-rich sequence DNA-binding factor-like protein n=1 Tax=Striga asiatica TaxID=4170 RepID=A0A5A7QNP2_STRAF|nr:GC-rich sequence DNA-binding factor-like protein [Striga asiatica]
MTKSNPSTKKRNLTPASSPTARIDLEYIGQIAGTSASIEVQFCLWQETLLLRIIERLARAEKTSLLFQECNIFHHSDLFDGDSGIHFHISNVSERTSHSLAKKQLLFEKLLNNQGLVSLLCPRQLAIAPKTYDDVWAKTWLSVFYAVHKILTLTAANYEPDTGQPTERLGPTLLAP